MGGATAPNCGRSEARPCLHAVGLAALLLALLVPALWRNGTAHAAQTDPVTEAGLPAVVGAGGATLCNDVDGLSVEQLSPGGDDALRAATTAHGSSAKVRQHGGWAAADNLIVVRVDTLPDARADG
ncbi:MAG: hypothetical protein R2851_21980 [Caldilineaceae bacterium]